MKEHELRSLRHARGPCPSAEQLVDYAALAPEARAGHPIDAHVQLCSRCQLVLLHLEEAAAPAAARLSRWALPLAAALVIAVGAAVAYRSFVPAAPAVDTVRGSELQPIGPAGPVTAPWSFEWQSPVVAARYRVTVYRGSTVVWTGFSDATRLAPDIAFVRGEYHWQVDALDRENVVRMTSPRQMFVVR